MNVENEQIKRATKAVNLCGEIFIKEKLTLFEGYLAAHFMRKGMLEKIDPEDQLLVSDIADQIYKNYMTSEIETGSKNARKNG